MRLLIDGYNLMHAVNLPSRRLATNELRKFRQRFLNDLAARLGPIDALQAVVIFDAASAPANRLRETRHKGLTVIFADEDEGADARIEQLIAKHSAPKGLTVVSSDHRVRQAATRRKARALGSDEFWSQLSSKRAPQPPRSLTREEVARREGLTPAEAQEWQETFGDVVDEPEIKHELGPSGFVPTDDEIRRIEREVEEEP